MSTHHRELLAIEASHLSTLRATGRAFDDEYVRRLMALSDAASEYDAATDGAYHHAYEATEADRRYAAAKRNYDRAGAEFADYARQLAAAR